MNSVHIQSQLSTIAPDSPPTTTEQPVKTEERVMEIVFVSCSFLLSGLLFFFLF
jgi:hypothetical protein